MFRYLLCPVVLLTLVTAAGADVLTMDQGRLYSTFYDNGGMGSGRGIGFQANQSFQLISAGIDLDVPASATAPTYQFEIFSSTDGTTAGPLLAATTFNLAEATGYQDQPFGFSFVEDEFYVFHFSRVDDSHLGDLGTHYSWEDPGTFVPFDYGILTMIEGFVGSSPNNSNPLLPHIRFEFNSAPVPEPASFALWGLGVTVAGLVAHRRRRRR